MPSWLVVEKPTFILLLTLSGMVTPFTVRGLIDGLDLTADSNQMDHLRGPLNMATVLAIIVRRDVETLPNGSTTRPADAIGPASTLAGHLRQRSSSDKFA